MSTRRKDRLLKSGWICHGLGWIFLVTLLIGGESGFSTEINPGRITINGFEDYKEIGDWSQENAAINWCDEKSYVKEGKASGKVTFMSGDSIWPGISLKSATGALSVNDWSKYDLLSLWVYNPQDFKITLWLYIEDHNGSGFWNARELIPREWKKIQFSVKQMSRASGKVGRFDVSNIKSLRFYLNPPVPVVNEDLPQPNGVILYFDNLQLSLYEGEEKEVESGISLIADFESGIQVSTLGVEGNISKALSQQYVMEGKSSCQVIFPSGIDIWPGIIFSSSGGTLISNWEGYYALAFDVYNPQSKEINLGVFIRDSYDNCYWATIRLLPEQWNHEEILIEEIKSYPVKKETPHGYVDGKTGDFSLKEVKLLKLYLNPPIGVFKKDSPQPNGPTLYFDDIKLISSSEREKKEKRISELSLHPKKNKKISIEDLLKVDLDFKRDYQRKDLALGFVGYCGKQREYFGEKKKIQVCMYLPGEQVTIIGNIENQSEKTFMGSFTYMIKDFFKETVKQEILDIQLVPKFKKTFELKYIPSRNGVYYLHWWLNDCKGEKIKSGVTTFSVIPQEEEPKVTLEDSPFGVCFGVPDLMPVGGFRWNRIDFNQEWIDKEGRYDWRETDKWIRYMEKYNYIVAPILNSIKVYESIYPPKIEDWQEFVRTTINRYREKIKYWEILNEPNNYRVFYPKGSRVPIGYIELLKTAYLTAKEVDPSCKIISAGVWHRDFKYIEKFLEAGGAKYCDIFALHPYSPRFIDPEKDKIDEVLQKIKRLLDKYSEKDIPIWLNEFAWPADDLDPDARCFLTEQEQVSYLIKMYTICLSRDYVKKLFWFLYWHPRPRYRTPDGLAPDGGHRVIYYNYRAKPILVAHRTLVHELEGTKFLNKQEIEGIKSYVFSKGEAGEVAVLWCNSGKVPVFVEVKGKAKMVDVMYNVREITNVEGKILVTVDSIPVFIEAVCPATNTFFLTIVFSNLLSDGNKLI